MSKEFRALLPIWAGSVIMIAVAGFGLPGWPTAARMLLGFASVVLSAMSVGHEYVYGTLPLLLTVPASRRRHLVNKLAALVPMLLSLALLAMLVLPDDPGFDRDTSLPRLSLLFAVLVAPLFTMLTRSPLGGVVFAVGFTGFMQSLATTGWHQTALIAGGAVGVVGGWWLFMRLEVKESGNASLDLPDWFLMAPHKGAPYGTIEAAPYGSSRPIWLLVQKELRLQQMAFVTTAAYLLLWVGVSLAWWWAPDVHEVLPALGIVYGALLSILIGALAGAEERHMHTLEWQLLLPVAAWKQWTVKVVVAIMVTLVLSLVLPTLMAGGKLSFNLMATAAVLVLTIGSLYVATLCDSSVAALVIATPVMFLLLAVGMYWFATAILGGVQSWPLKIAVPLLLALALQFGYRNYITASRDVGRVGWQVSLMLAILAVVGSMYYAAHVSY